jgi:hypothetical protein
MGGAGPPDGSRPSAEGPTGSLSPNRRRSSGVSTSANSRHVATRPHVNSSR